MPPIPGLAEASALTNETLFSLVNLPARLIIIGGGPIGCEMAQAFNRFGARVTLVEKADRVLPNEDPDASAVLKDQLADQFLIARNFQFLTGLRNERNQDCMNFVVNL